MKSIKIEVVFIIITLFAGIAANSSFAKDNESNKFSYPTPYPYPTPTIHPGSLDTTFDDDGLVTTAIGSYDDEARAVAVQSNGKIVIAGRFSNPGHDDFFLARYNDNGSLDTSFDTDGIATISFGNDNDDVARALAIQTDGKIVVAGYTSPDGSEAELALTRYNSNGSLDTSFDIDGKVTTNLGGGYDFLSAMAIQPDGKIVVVGSKYIGINNDDFAVIRYNSNGSLDTTFDTDGIVTTAIGSGYEVAASVVIRPDGKIIVGGVTYNGSNQMDFALVRYNNNGSLDTSFNSDGIATKDFGIGSGFERGGHVALQSDGKIVIAGNNDDGYFLLARYNNDGTLDTSFDTDGLVSNYFGDGNTAVQDIALQANGKIVIAGFANMDNDFAVARYNSDGTLDTSFDLDGKAITDFGSNQDDLGNSVTIQPDGKIVVAGYRYIGGSGYDVALARYIGDYDIDTTAPSVSTIIRTKLNPSGSKSVNFTVVFSEDVTGVDMTGPVFDDFALTTSSGISGASVTAVSGSGATYTVTVNTGSGNGTIRLDVIDHNSILDASSNPLGGPAMGDGNFITGEVYTIEKSAGSDTAGVFRPSTATFYLRNSNSAGAPDITRKFGLKGDYPVVGDWDGNGTDTIGVYRSGVFYLSNSNTTGHIDLTFAFGKAGDQPIAGDWNGDGIDTIGIYRSSKITFLLRNSNSAGPADATFKLGSLGDVGIAGDWNGDGVDTTGVFRPKNGALYLKNANTTGYADTVITYGVKNDKPVTGDWNNDGVATIGIYRNALFYLRNTNTKGYADFFFAFGANGDMPLAGNWDGIP